MARRGLGKGAIALIVIDAILIVVLIVLLVTHPRPLGQDGDDPPGEVTDSAAPGDGVGAAAEPEESPETPDPALEIPDDARDLSEFAMPSRNIWCQIGEEAFCFIGHYTFRPPSVDTCDSEVGPVVQLTSEGATFPCVTDEIGSSAPSDAPDLDYGEHTVVGDFWCSSEETGVTCRSVETGRGFTLAVGGFITF